MEQQFTEVEKRFVLAEAIKKSSIPVDRLVSVLGEYNVLPDWEHMLLPNGRDLSQCKHAFELLRNGPPSQLHTPQPYPQTFLNPAPVFPGPSGKRQSTSMPSGHDTKKRKSGVETPNLARDLLPKPTTSNGPQMPTMTSSPAPTSQKKRGRPSKADVERKQKEAIERGDIIPPASVTSSPAGLQGQDDRPGVTPVMILPAPSARNLQPVVTPGHMPSPQMGVEHPPTPTMGGEAPGKKRKPRPPPKPKVQKPGEHQFSINTPVGQPGQGENPFATVSTETTQAGSMADPAEARNPPASIAPATPQDQAPESQPKPDDK